MKRKFDPYATAKARNDARLHSRPAGEALLREMDKKNMAVMKVVKPTAPARLTSDQAYAALKESFGKYIERVEPKQFIGDDDIDSVIAQKLFNGEITDFEQLTAIFGGKRYADKDALVLTGAPFRITRVVERVRGSFNKEDDWAFEIVDEGTGEVSVLSFEKNPQRDIMVYIVVGGLAKFGVSSLLKLVRYELAETDTRPAGRSFYTFASIRKTGPVNVTPTYEG
jgi:hypothetical protein